MNRLINILTFHQFDFSTVLPEAWQFSPALVLDLSGRDHSWYSVDISCPYAMQLHTKRLLKSQKAKIAIGRYNEDRRLLYQRSELFHQNNNDLRSIHLGIDLSVPTNTPVFAPLAGKVHSIKNNHHYGDYGPTVILEHQLEDVRFFTLYGHLSLSSLKINTVNQMIEKGQLIGKVGSTKINGNWPTHLHFQIITDLKGGWGDFPGVIDAARRDEYLALCPDPNLILQMDI